MPPGGMGERVCGEEGKRDRWYIRGLVERGEWRGDRNEGGERVVRHKTAARSTRDADGEGWHGMHPFTGEEGTQVAHHEVRGKL